MKAARDATVLNMVSESTVMVEEDVRDIYIIGPETLTINKTTHQLMMGTLAYILLICCYYRGGRAQLIKIMVIVYI